MRRNLFYLVAIFAITLTAVGCSKKEETVKGEKVAAAVVKGVTLENVKSAAIQDFIEVTGTVRARTTALVSPRIAGTVSLLRFREGDHVKKGELLAQLDAQENQANAALATAVIDDASRAVDEALSRKKLADITFERYQSLYKENAATRQEFDVKLSEKETAAQAVARAESRLKQAKEGAKAATTISDYTKILAPISGIIASKQGDLGATLFPGQPLMTIEDDKTYQLELSIPENLMDKVKSGTSLKVTLDGTGVAFNAKIAEIVPVADPTGHTFIAKIQINQKGVKSGMFGRASIASGSGGSAITIPKKAILEHGALTSVWAVDKDNLANIRIIKTGRDSGDRIEVLSGISAGDRVVTAGGEKISEGAKVE